MCRELRKYFEVRIAANADFTDFIRQEGIETFDCTDFNSAEVIKAVRKFNFSWLNSDLPEKIFAEQVRLIQDLKPVAVLGDHSPTLKMAAEKTGTVFISLINGYMSRHYRDHRPISRYHPAYKLLYWLPEHLRVRATVWGEAKAFRALHRSFNKIRTKEKLKSFNNYLEELEGDVTLICDLPCLFPQHRLPPGYYFAGPLFYDRGVNDKQQPLVMLHPKKTIIVSMGSSGEWIHAKFLNDVSYASFNVIAIGDGKRVLNASHINHVRFGNVHELFPQADLIICHGGNGTIYQAMLYNLPVLAFTTHCEQEWNMHALEKHGLGYRLDGINDEEQLRSIIVGAITRPEQNADKQISEAIHEAMNAMPGVIAKIAAGFRDKQPRFPASIKAGEMVKEMVTR